MKRPAKLLEEWEKTLLLTTAGVVALFFLILFWPSDQEGNISQQGTLPPTPDYVKTDDMAFLEPAKLEKTVNPMAFRRKLPVAPKDDKKQPPKDDKKQPPKDDKKQPPKDDKKAPVQPPKDDKKQPPKDDKKAPVQPPKDDKKQLPVKKADPRIITLTYRGIYKGLQETELAFVRTVDSAAKNKMSSMSVQAGEKLHGLFTVVSFDENQMNLLDQNQKTLTVPRNKAMKVTIE